MKLEIRRIDKIRELNFNEGSNEVYFLKVGPDGKNEKFKIADVVVKDDKLIYRFIENVKTSPMLTDLKKKMRLWNFLEHQFLKKEKETLNIAVENEDGSFVEKMFAERCGEMYRRYLNTDNIQAFVSMIEELARNEVIGNTKFVSETGRTEILFGNSQMPECIIAGGIRLERIEKIESISEEGKEIYSKNIKYEVSCASLEAGSEIYRMLCKFGYDDTEIERALLRKALMKLLPKNNLTGKKELSGWKNIIFDKPVKLDAEIIKAASTLFNYTETVEHKEALNIVREAVEKNITKFVLFSDEARITVDDKTKFEFNFVNRMPAMAEKVKEILEAKIEEFDAVTLNKIRFKKEKGILTASKENFAKNDFNALKNLSEAIGKPVEYIIRREYDFFSIAGNELKIKVSALRYETEKDKIFKKYKCLKEFFEKISIEKGI